MIPPMLLLASPGGGAGTTTVCLGIARALSRQGLKVATFKTGTDSEDTILHDWALHQPCLNLDSWAMRFDTLCGLARDSGEGMDVLFGDGHDGLFDGDPLTGGSDADLASLLNIGILLVIDAAGAGRSLAPMVEGLLRCREDVEIVGIFLNRVKSAAHAGELIAAFNDRFSTPVVGYLIDDPSFELEEHHQRAARALDAEEVDDILLEIEQAVVDVTDLDRLVRLTRAPSIETMIPYARPLPAFGQRIAVAQDEAFAYGLQAIMTGWHRQNVQLFPFSPLADEPPSLFADAVYLPAGPFEDYVGLLATRREFMKGMAEAVTRRTVIFGEGLGYGVLGEYMVDGEGVRHAMTALLPVTTQVQMPTALAGYRQLKLQSRHPLGPVDGELRGTDPDNLAELEQRADPLFSQKNGDGVDLGTIGCRFETVAGSPIRLIDRHPHLAIVRS